jgi:hypothetical protein
MNKLFKAFDTPWYFFTFDKYSGADYNLLPNLNCYPLLPIIYRFEENPKSCPDDYLDWM